METPRPEAPIAPGSIRPHPQRERQYESHRMQMGSRETIKILTDEAKGTHNGDLV